MNEQRKQHIRDFFLDQRHLNVALASRAFAQHDIDSELDYLFCIACESESDQQKIYRSTFKLPGKLVLRCEFHCNCGGFSGRFDVSYSEIFQLMQTIDR